MTTGSLYVVPVRYRLTLPDIQYTLYTLVYTIIQCKQYEIHKLVEDTNEDSGDIVMFIILTCKWGKSYRYKHRLYQHMR